MVYLGQPLGSLFGTSVWGFSDRSWIVFGAPFGTSVGGKTQGNQMPINKQFLTKIK